MKDTRGPSSWSAVALGSALWAAFILSSFSLVGMSIPYITPWHNFAASELMFWVSALLFLLPGSMCLSWALAPKLVQRVREQVAQAREREGYRAATLLLIFSLMLMLSSLGYHIVLSGFPTTDDENAARLGGQILASGAWREAIPGGWEAFPKIFLYTHVESASYQSFDWPGILFAWMIAEVSALGPTLFQLAAALTPAALFWGVERRYGLLAGLLATALYICSPMAMTLSWASHAHVLSRCAVAGVFAASIGLAASDGKRWRWGLLGAVWGAGLLVRPLEVFTLCAPLVAVTLWAPLKGRDIKALGAFGLGLGAFIALFMLSNHAITGDALVQARFAVLESGVSAHHKPPLAFLTDGQLLLSRLSNNLAYNVLNLLLWAMTPLALLLVWLGAGRDRVTRAALAGVVWSLLLTLLHDDYGLHIVGPIHYSEAIIPLIYMMIAGIFYLRERFGEASREYLGAALLGMMMTGVLITGWEGYHLHKQSLIHQSIYSTFEDDPRYAGSVILAPQYGVVWRNIPEHAAIGSFVFEWRPVSPARDEPVIFLHHIPALIPQLVREFPERAFFVMVPLQTPPYVAAVPLEEHLRGANRGALSP